ncbi:MAG: benzoate-CoA ligase family protein [Acidipila sp.]|nr:benzoate-CoA ligase family protein [Acidipila sp.]
MSPGPASPCNIAHHFIDLPASNHPTRIAIVGEPLPITYGDLAKMVNRAGNALLASGCRPGDRVLLVLPDSAEFIAAFFGAAKIGAIPVPVNPFARAASYAHYLEDSGARFALVHQIAWQEFSAAREGKPLAAVVLVGPETETPAPSHCVKWSRWLADASSNLAASATLSSDIAFFLYTSGSGGTPKAAVHEHKNMLATSANYAHAVLGLASDDITYSVSKLFFAYGLGNGMYLPLSVGARTILDPGRPRVDRTLEIVARHHPTIFFAVPTFYAALLSEVERGLPADFSSVRLAVSAGEALPAEIFTQFKNRFGLEILDGIGSTEMLHMFLSSRSGQARAGSCGTAVPSTQARILDEVETPVCSDQIGNLWVKGPSALREYWNQPELTARTIRDGWVFTGDKFWCDADGYYHHSGRCDDMLKVAGKWVSPGEVENALLGHAAVAEAAVVGKLNALGLYEPVAFVVLRSSPPPGSGFASSAALANEIIDFANTRLAAYKCPRSVIFLPELPKTATGKIQRFKLRA